MSPLFRNTTLVPKSDAFWLIVIVGMNFRTSARVALPSAHALVTAPTTTWAATYEGSPKNSPLPLWALM